MRQLRVNGIYERDIDTVFGALICSEDLLQRKLLEFCKYSFADHELQSVEISSFSSNGESDLEVCFSSQSNKNKSIFIFIENKITACFQPHQFERYKERAQNKICREDSKGNNAETVVLLVAPACYLRRRKIQFEKAISYEELEKLLALLNTDMARLACRLLHQALERAEKGYNQITDDEVSRIWRRFYEIANSEYPELEMEEPDFKPAKSSFILLKCIKQKNLQLKLKFHHGNVDIELKGMAEIVDNLPILFRLPDGIRADLANKAAALRATFPKLLLSDSVSEREAKIRKGLEKARQLLVFYRENIEKFNNMVRPGVCCKVLCPLKA